MNGTPQALPGSPAVEVDPILRRFGTWAVTTYGVECLVTEYQIPWSRLGEPDWPDHVTAKRWVDAGDFLSAYAWACEQGGPR